MHGRYREPCPRLRHAGAAHPLRRQRDQLLSHLPDRRPARWPIARSLAPAHAGLAAEPGRDGGETDPMTVMAALDWHSRMLGVRHSRRAGGAAHRLRRLWCSRGSCAIPSGGSRSPTARRLIAGRACSASARFLPLADGEDAGHAGRGRHAAARARADRPGAGLFRSLAQGRGRQSHRLVQGSRAWRWR